MLKLLPLCRKEKYFTSCILPQLLCGDDLQRLNDFLKYLSIDQTFIHDKYSLENLLFYTEYSLKESANWEELKNHSSKETPDLILLIKNRNEKSYFLIVIEAKMYNKTNASDFREQLNLQKPIIDIIKRKIEIKDNNCLHIGLLKNIPIGLEKKLCERLITWSDILKIYEELKDNYFYQILNYAVSNSLLSKPLSNRNNHSTQREKNYRDKYTFDQIIQMCEKEGNHILIGFNNGKKALFHTDIEVLKSRKYKWDYVSSSNGKKVKSNWIIGADFLDIIKKK